MNMMQEPTVTTYAPDDLSPVCALTGFSTRGNLSNPD